MLRAGIAMRHADETDLGRYLQILAHTHRRAAREEKQEKASPLRRGGGEVIELRRAYADEVFGK